MCRVAMSSPIFGFVSSEANILSAPRCILVACSGLTAAADKEPSSVFSK